MTSIIIIHIGNSEVSLKHFNRNSKASLTAMERNQNEEIQKSMTHKLHYKRNPHNNPENVKKLLIQPNQRKEISGNRAMKNNENGNSFGTSSSLKSTKTKNIPLFIAEPASVEFLEFSIGDVLKLTLCLRNISTISRTLRVLPPAGGRFGMSPLIYPSGILSLLFFLFFSFLFVIYSLFHIRQSFTCFFSLYYFIPTSFISISTPLFPLPQPPPQSTPPDPTLQVVSQALSLLV
jgi:hypothetical protein